MPITYNAQCDLCGTKSWYNYHIRMSYFWENEDHWVCGIDGMLVSCPSCAEEQGITFDIYAETKEFLPGTIYRACTDSARAQTHVKSARNN